MLSLLILVPLFGVILLNLPWKIGRSLAFPFAAAIFLIQMYLALAHQQHIGIGQIDAFDHLFNVNLGFDALSFIMLLTIGIVSLASLVIGHYTVAHEEKRFEFINLLIIATVGMSGVVMARDIFSLYVFLEVTAVSSFILITFQRDRLALEGAFKYIILSLVASVMMLSSIAYLLIFAGNVSFEAIVSALQAPATSTVAILGVVLFMCGLFIKGGLVPFHGWLPDAYTAAPAPVSVFLAGIVTKVSGIYTLIRIVASVFGFDERLRAVLMLVGIVSILIGAFAAMGQKDFKRMLAYSSISQVGYIIAGLGTGSPLGVIGAVFHLFNHAIFKSLLFVNAAAVEREAGTRRMDEMGGLSVKMPVTGATSVIALLSTCGIPPLAGFWSKFIIILALWQVGSRTYAVIAILASIMTLAYLLSMQRQVFFGKLKKGFEHIKEAPAGFVVVSVMLALITIGVGVAFPVIFVKFIEPVALIIR